MHTAESMAVVGRLLEINPDVAVAWNFRRECIRCLGYAEDAGTSAGGAEDGADTAGDDTAVGRSPQPVGGGETSSTDPSPSPSSSRTYAPALTDELALTEKTLRKNPKGYASWHHRRWTIEKLVDTPGRRDDTLRQEMALIGQMLDVDDRNFHCWNHRRFVVKLIDGGRASDEAELTYTTRKIELNFSNYSAWHSRTKALPRVHGETLSKETLDEEYELVRQAFFTEPEDQSGWIYHRWLTAQTLKGGAQGSAGDDEVKDARRAETMDTLSREAGFCREVSEMEPGSKWPVVTRARLVRATGTEDARLEAGDEFVRLASLDPMRVGYYCDCCDRR